MVTVTARAAVGNSAFPDRHIQREIFEYTAELYPGVIPTLLCVAHRVLVWIEPIVYHTIYVESSRRFFSFLAATKLKDPSVFATHVNRILIYISFDPPLEAACAALALCTNVTAIAGAGPLVSPPLLSVLTSMRRLQRIGLFLTHIFRVDVDLTLPCFQTLTHFDVFDYLMDEYDAMEYATKLCMLPVLTHLALNDMVPWEAVEKLLQDCGCLQVLVVQWSESKASGQERAEEAPFNDVRFLMTTFDRMEDAALNPPNLWSQAEAFIADKRRGNIDSRCFWMTRGEEEDEDELENEEPEQQEQEEQEEGSSSDADYILASTEGIS
ncbi:hypothetical protein C8F01DRAFT_1366561 [Mycena amicta]|nr:hypothetical protein C8F01DRAFT_1366561 [Mycena amicta]